MHARGSFHVCALRMPMIYDIDDPMVVGPLLKGNLTHVPDTGNCVTEFVYVENAAAAHVKAVEALLSDDGGEVGGRPYNVTNGDKTPRSSIAVWNSFVEVVNRKCKSKGKLKRIKKIPIAILRVVAYTSSFLFWITCGHVPFRRHPFWNLTPASLALACTSVSQDVRETTENSAFGLCTTLTRAWAYGFKTRKRGVFL